MLLHPRHFQRFLLIAQQLSILCSACRWVLYASSSDPITLAQIWVEPLHSLVKQSYLPPYLPNITSQRLFDTEKNEMRNHEINQDGWGVGWYNHNEESGEVVLHRHRSSNGATDQYQHMDSELEQLVYKHPPISSRVIFSHLRASTDGAPSAKDSHPFIFGQLLWMHNGGVHDKVALMEECGGPNLRQLVSGNTDTEYAGALFASYLRPSDKNKDNVTDHDVCHPRNGFTLDELTRAMKHTVARLRENDDKTGDGSSLNLAVTDGIHVVAIRYRTRVDEEPPSLYYSFNISSPSLWIASEPLEKETEENNQQWMLMAKDSMITFSTLTGEISQACLTQACEEELFHRRRQENDT